MKLKKKGSIEKFAIPLVAIVGMFMMFILFIGSSGDIQKKYKVDELARRYLLRVEAEGYLIPTDQQDLITELQSIGATNISLSGTTTSKVGYGNKVSLAFTCDVSVTDYDIMSNAKIKQGKRTLTIPMNKSSTAKN